MQGESPRRCPRRLARRTRAGRQRQRHTLHPRCQRSVHRRHHMKGLLWGPRTSARAYATSTQTRVTARRPATAAGHNTESHTATVRGMSPRAAAQIAHATSTLETAGDGTGIHATTAYERNARGRSTYAPCRTHVPPPRSTHGTMAYAGTGNLARLTRAARIMDDGAATRSTDRPAAQRHGGTGVECRTRRHTSIGDCRHHAATGNGQLGHHTAKQETQDHGTTTNVRSRHHNAGDMYRPPRRRSMKDNHVRYHDTRKHGPHRTGTATGHHRGHEGRAACRQ